MVDLAQAPLITGLHHVTAISGNAPNPNPDPYALTAYDAHSQPN